MNICHRSLEHQHMVHDSLAKRSIAKAEKISKAVMTHHHKAVPVGARCF